MQDNVMDVYVLMLREGMKKSLCRFTRFTSIVRLIALILSYQSCFADGLDNLMAHRLDEYQWWKWWLCL